MRPLATVIATFALAMSLAAPAAAANGSPSPSPTSSSDQGKSALAATAKLYKSAVMNRDITMRAINDEFTLAIKRAKRSFSIAMSKASSPAMKSSAAARFKDAIDRATATRQAALDSLPLLPPSPAPRPNGK